MKRMGIWLIAVMLLFTLAACSEKDTKAEPPEDQSEESTNTPVNYEDIDVEELPKTEEGSKTVSEEFAELPDILEMQHVGEKHTMILTFYFEEGKAVNGYVTNIYQDVAQAKSVYDSYVKNSEYYANVTREEGTITYTHTETSFEFYQGKTKEEIKEAQLESGFEVTKE